MDPFTGRMRLDARVIRLTPWKLWTLVAVGGGITVALAIAVAGLLLILIPVLLGAGLIGRFLLGRPPTPPTRPRHAGDVIDGEYEVLPATTERDRL